MHLAQVSRSYRQLWRERAALQAKLTALYEDERELGEALLAAQRSADRVVADAEEEARKLVAHAEGEARKLVAQARDQAKRTADELALEHEREAGAVARLGAVRRELEARLHELADAIVAVVDDADTDLQSALAMPQPSEVADEQAPVASSNP